MAESEKPVEGQEQEQLQDDEQDQDLGYKPPAPKSLDDIINTDAEDESLVKYKKQLLGDGASSQIFYPDDPRTVIIRKMSIRVEGRDDLELNLEDPSKLDKKMKFVVKEGAKYRIMLSFHVQREIVCGLRFTNIIKKGPIKVEKDKHMVGSYGPKAELQTWTSSEEEFPSGMLARGSYHATSSFTDDDKKDILCWDWNFELKKDWQ